MRVGGGGGVGVTGGEDDCVHQCDAGQQYQDAEGADVAGGSGERRQTGGAGRGGVAGAALLVGHAAHCKGSVAYTP
ncbi:hypothetical protein [Nocardia sp. N2S4-5]|uniref:hypothetical protein n=1 Tax=Nocardia sp. N2S4-5 TaxID=3351565 RepID=UPI0037CE958B